MDLEKTLTILEITLIFSGIMLYLSSYYLSTSGTIIKIIPPTKEKQYHTYLVEYLYLGNFRRIGKYRSNKLYKKFQENSGVRVYLNPYGNLRIIGKRPIIQEERNIQFQIDFYRLVFLLSFGGYFYLLYLKKKSPLLHETPSLH
jgi:hypothetical protein